MQVGSAENEEEDIASYVIGSSLSFDSDMHVEKRHFGPEHVVKRLGRSLGRPGSWFVNFCFRSLVRRFLCFARELLDSRKESVSVEIIRWVICISSCLAISIIAVRVSLLADGHLYCDTSREVPSVEFS